MTFRLVLMMFVWVGSSLFTLHPQTATAEDREVDLSDPVRLQIRYEIGETFHYRLVRRSDFIAMDGSKFGGHEVVAYFTRTRIEDDDMGRVRERFTWQHFAHGQALSADQPPPMTTLEEARGFSLTLSVQDEDAIEKFDFSGIPRTLGGMWFMIMSWDAVTFDGPVRSQEHFYVPESIALGTEIAGTRPPHDFTFEYPPVLTDCKYRFSGDQRTRVLGITDLGGIPCVVVDFAYAGNTIEMNVMLEPVELHNRGYEHFWGHTYLSLEDGSIVRGELIAPVLQVQDMVMAGQDQAQHKEYLVLQRLELGLLSPEDFDSQLRKLSEPVLGD
jgi:hypothetical protein